MATTCGATTVRRTEEHWGKRLSFERTAGVSEQHDYLIVPFIHHRTTDFPIAREQLSVTCSVHHWQISGRAEVW